MEKENRCNWCREKIEGSFGYDPKTGDKFHFPCWANYRRELYEKSMFQHTEYPPRNSRLER